MDTFALNDAMPVDDLDGEVIAATRAIATVALHLRCEARTWRPRPCPKDFT